MVAVPGNGAKKLDTRLAYRLLMPKLYTLDRKRTVSCSIERGRIHRDGYSKRHFNLIPKC